MKTKLSSLKIWKLIFPLMLLLCFLKSNAQCSPDVLILLTQADVDNFGVTYPAVTDWDGSIQVGEYNGSSNITNLNGLSNLETICGELTIRNCPILPNLIGLENLTHLGNLTILVNPLLTNLEGLNNLNSIDDYLSIASNNMLVNLQGLGNLNSVAILSINNNNALTNLTGLGGLNLTNYLYINENPVITSLSGLTLLNSQLDNVYINYNPMLENIDALQPLTVVNDIAIGYNDILNKLDGLSNIVSVPLSLAIYECPNVINVDALQNLTSTGIFTLAWTNVTNLNGLLNLQTADEIFLYDCPQIENLSGLENLISLKRIQLDSCALLNSIDALENVVMLDYNPATDPYPPHLWIFYNPLLAECAIAPICDKITDPEFIIDIGDNAVGCESIQTVINACNLGVADLSSDSVKIFPNPSNSIVNISGSDFLQVKIFDMMGRKVMDVQIENNSFNVEKLAAGSYLSKLIGKSGEFVVQDLIMN